MTRGIRTTEFWITTLTSLVLMVNGVFGLGLELSDETAATIVGGITAAYALGRSIVKALSKGSV